MSLREQIAEMVHVYMRDGDPHTWPDALEFADAVLALIAQQRAAPQLERDIRAGYYPDIHPGDALP